MSESPEPPPPREAEMALAWNPGRGDPPITSTRIWRRNPHAEVFLGGTWCPATVMQRQDWADGRIIYGLDVRFPGETSTRYQMIRWHPGSLRPRP